MIHAAGAWKIPFIPTCRRQRTRPIPSYYDFVDFGDGRVGVIVGDVSGKGVSAAFYMSEMKGNLPGPRPHVSFPEGIPYPCKTRRWSALLTNTHSLALFMQCSSWRRGA